MRPRAFVVAAVLGAACVTGGWLVQRGSVGADGDYDRAHLFDNVLRHVSRYYVDSLSEGVLYEKAVTGMLRGLKDPHTVYLTQQRLSRLTESTSGRYDGVGIRIEVRDEWITIIAPLPGTPAAVAGIQTGDRIVEIEGKATHGWSVEDATQAIRGKPGTKVSFVVERPGVEARIPFNLTRREVHLRSVQHVSEIRPGVGYVDVDVFSESTAEELEQALRSLNRQGINSLILDLRDNPGGLLDQGVSVSDLFLDPGQKIVAMRGRVKDANRIYSDRAAQSWGDLPIVVLIDSGSASASEIVAGALQDHDRALLVGTTSFGKGSAQSLYGMVDGGALKVTTARWFTPSGRSIDRPSTSSDEDEEEEDPLVRPDSTQSKSARFSTDAGRVVFGGGGIAPDVIVNEYVPTDADKAFQKGLGDKLPAFRDALATYALSLRGSHALASPAFEVTPAMRDELWRRMVARGIRVDRATYDASPLVTRMIGFEIARLAFGVEEAFLRTTRDDRAILTALELVNGVKSQSELLTRAAARGKAGTAPGTR